jgi:hypothetical protein
MQAYYPSLAAAYSYPGMQPAQLRPTIMVPVSTYTWLFSVHSKCQNTLRKINLKTFCFTFFVFTLIAFCMSVYKCVFVHVCLYLHKLKQNLTVNITVMALMCITNSLSSCYWQGVHKHSVNVIGCMLWIL